MRLAIALVCLSCLVGTTLAGECDGVSYSCDMIDLGGNQYEMVLTLVNGSPDPNGIFMWSVFGVPLEWETVSFVLPSGWAGAHPDHHLSFAATDNGSGEVARLYSASAASCGHAVSLEFRWTFENNGGPDPACTVLSSRVDYHLQGVDPLTCANVGQSFVCPPAVPTEQVSWGRIKSRFE